MKPFVIQPNFKIPKGYRRQFLFLEKGTDFRCEIVVSDRGVELSSSAVEASGGIFSRSLDWCQEVIEKVRTELDYP